MKKELAVTTDNVGQVMDELNEAFFDIPFENSDYQNRAFVMSAQITPGRAYRAIGLRMYSKIRAVKSHLIDRKRAEIKMEKKKAKIDSGKCSSYKVRLLELDILEYDDSRGHADKLLNDALRELNCLYIEFKKLPKYDREAFEKEEVQHFGNRLDRQTKGIVGAVESIHNMKHDLPNWEESILRALNNPELKLIEAT